MKKKYHILLMPLIVLTALLTAACSNDSIPDETIPEGMGRIRITISTPEENPSLTRAVNATPWEPTDHPWEDLQTFRIIICNTSGTIVDIIDGTNANKTVTSSILPVGDYHIYATANFDENGYANATSDGFTIDSPIQADTKTIKLTNGYSEKRIPMTGKLTTTPGGNVMQTVTVTNGAEANAGTITVWRMMGKMLFDFTNETSGNIKIKGIEVEPINQASSTGPGIFFFSKDNLTSTANLVPFFPAGATKSVTATWALDETPSQNQAAFVTKSGVFESTTLLWGNKLQATGSVTTYDNVYTLQKFKTTGNVESKDAAAVITFKVEPKVGMEFTPKSLSFKVCRVGTDGGKFDVEAGGSPLSGATGVTPPRSNGDGGNSGNHIPPFYKEYHYALSGTPTIDEYVVNIYLYGLNEKEYAFRDVVISGDVTNNTGSPLQEYVTLPSGTLNDAGAVTYEPSTALELAAKNDGNTDEGNLFFYVNETDATFTTTENQLSVRFKIQRQNGSGWYDDEIRFGLTTPYINGSAGGDGFNVIRRNDWIHIPVHLRDWQFRIEPVAFVPIAGYPAKTLSSDGLTATFSTGGPIILQPFAQKNNDGTWRDFSDSEVTFVSLSWKNNDGTNVSGSGKIFVTPLAYDSVTKCITGELNNNLAAGTYMTTITVNTKLGPSGSQYDYSFTFNVVLQK